MIVIECLFPTQQEPSLHLAGTADVKEAMNWQAKLCLNVWRAEWLQITRKKCTLLMGVLGTEKLF